MSNQQLNEQLSGLESEILLQLISHYDQYIQNALKNECFQHADWEPLTIEDYYDTEFKLLAEISPKEHETEQQIAATTEEIPNTSWSTFSKQQILKPKPKPWWRKLLPW